MWVGLLAGAAIVLYVAFRLWYRELRVVYKCRSVCEAWRAGVLPLVWRSLNGHRVCVFHQASGLLVQITKTLAGGGNDAKVNLHMVKVRIPNPGRFNMDAGRRYHRFPLRPRGSILRWHLPSVRKAARLSEVACGGSLRGLEVAVLLAFSEAGSPGEECAIYLWSDVQGQDSRTVGRFDDVPPER